MESLAPLGHVVEEVEKVAQGCETLLRQHAGEQHGGRGALLLGGKLLRLDKGFLQLGGQRGLWQLPEELLHQPSDITWERGGQALLASVQLGLEVQTQLLRTPEVRQH